MASNDPADTGGLFNGHRPGTAPARPRESTPPASGRRLDTVLAAVILVLETLLYLSLLGPQPLAWLWIASQVEYVTDAVTAGISATMLGCLTSLMLTMALA